MPVAVEDLYRPISDFFLKRFGTGDDAAVVFRFDKFGSLLSDHDFIDEHHPDQGFVAALAREKFSDLVNRVPLDAGDGVNVVLSQASIDEVYFFQLLSPALPAVPADADPATKAAVTDAFNAIKAEGVKLWNRLTLQSLSGLMLDFKPSLASPEDWYDTSSSQAWTSQTFHIDASTASPPTPVWRLRPRNEFLAQELKLPPATEFGREQVLEAVMKPAPALDAPVQAAEIPTVVGPADRARMAAGLTGDGPGNVHDLLLTDLSRVDLRSRIAASQYLGELAPQAPASTSSVSITFEYCLVVIRRPWWLDAFIDQGSWYLPAVPAGRLTATDSPAAISWLPTAFVAVKNLRIDASWSGDDAANAAMATDFGPFKVESAAGGQSLVHPGLQVIGWLLQRLPPLPPVSAPGSTPAPAVPRTYVVRAGDTLSGIARQFYGDAKRWPEIQAANGITNPNLIHIGDRLTIP
jgi:hypothetical protein